MSATNAAPSEENRSTVKSAWTVSSFTLASRILGFVRLILMVHLFGNLRWATDAFIFAFRIPNLFRNLLGEGALSAAFIPVFVKTERGEGKSSASILGSQIFSLLALIGGLVAIVGAGICLAVGAFSTNEEMSLAFRLSALLFPFMPLVCLAALLGGMLQSLGRFALPAALSIILNLGFLAGYAYVYWVQCGGDLANLAAGPATTAIALFVLAAGAIEVIVQLPVLWAAGILVRPAFTFNHPGLRRTLDSFLPVALGLGLVQVNAFFDSIIAGWIALSSPGAVTYLEIAFRFMQLPLGVFGVAIATVTFPALASSAAAEDLALFAERLVRAIRMSLFFILPCAAVLIAMADPIIRLAYQTPSLDFSNAAVYRSSIALVLYAAGLGFYSLRQIFVRAFYALGDYSFPVKVSAAMVALNLVLNLVLIHFPDLYRLHFPEVFRRWNLSADSFPGGIALGEAGLALATMLTAIVDSLILGLSLRKRIASRLPAAIRNEEGTRLLHTALRMLTTFAALVVLVYFYRNSIPYEPELMARLSRVVFPGLLAVGTFYILGVILPLPEMEEFLFSLLRRKRQSHRE